MSKGPKKWNDTKGNKSRRRMEEAVGSIDKDIDSKDGRQTKSKSKMNDASWYSRYPQILQDAANLPYAEPLGTTYSLGSSELSTTEVQDLVVPGLCVIRFIPTIGNAKDAYSAVNVATRNIYSFVRHENSGHANYDAPDLMMYLLAMDQAMMYHAFLKRAYGVARLYSPMNRYYPTMILQAMGLNPTDVYAHLADLRYGINMMAAKLGALAVPATMTYFDRHQWMCEGLYVDSTSVKAQTYMFVPYCFLQFNDTAEGKPGHLKSDGFYSLTIPGASDSAALMTVDQAINFFGQTIMAPLMNNEDFNIMSGDILKAYGSNIRKFDVIDEGYTVLPLYSEEVLSQIHNSVSLAPDTEISYTISQDTNIGGGYLLSDLAVYYETAQLNVENFDTAGKYLQAKHMLNMYKDSVSPAETMVATRLMMGGVKAITMENPPAGTTAYTVNAYGSEVVKQYEIWETTPNSSTPTVSQWGNRIVAKTSGISPLAGQAIFKVPQFDWAPQLWADGKAFHVNGDYLGGTWRPMFDVNNYTIIENDTLKRMHDVALMSLFDVVNAASGKR